MLFLLIFCVGLNFLIGRFFGYLLGKKGYSLVLSCSTLIGFVCICYDIWLLHFSELPLAYEVSLGTWIKVDEIEIAWNFLFDSLSIIMIIMVWLVSVLVHLYSYEYMRYEPSFIKFIAYLSLFTFFMFILLSAGNFLILFLGWEGVGLASYLLISFWSTRIPASKASLKALTMNRFGDFALLIAICIILKYFKTLDFVTIWTLLPYFAEKQILLNGTNFLVVDIIATLLVLAAVGKSAQIGLHTWLPDAMEGPTPVSALIHAATMVTAGIFLLIRCSYFLVYSPIIASWVVVIGSITTVAAGCMALVQVDIKRIIAYSTCSQLGYMFTACGTLNFAGSLFHLINHAFFKALLFLVAGAIIHNARGEQDLRKLGALYYQNKLYYIALLIASFSLMGFMGFSGYYSKEIIINQLYTTWEVSRDWKFLFGYWLSLFGVFLTSAYSMRLIYYLSQHQIKIPYKTFQYSRLYTPFIYKIIFSFLIILSITSGFWLQRFFIGGLFFIEAFYIDPFIVDVHFIPYFYKSLPIFLSLIGLILTLKIYLDNDVDTLGCLNEDGVYLGRFINQLYVVFSKGFFFDSLYNKIGVLILYVGVILHGILDKGILEALGPRGVARTLEQLALIVDLHHSRHINHMFVTMIFGFYLSVSFLFFAISIDFDFN